MSEDHNDPGWFERYPACAHRVRMPFPGEADKEAAQISTDPVSRDRQALTALIEHRSRADA
jgi:hypothetical protein